MIDFVPPRRQFSKDDIVTEAFKIAAEEGLDGITACKVAERLGSFVAPIYSNFEDIKVELPRFCGQ